MRQPRKVTPETGIKRQIKGYLGAHGWFSFPIVQGMGSYPGLPDMIAIKGGKVLFVEVKAPRGVQSEYQKQFETLVSVHGGTYILARSYEDVERAIKNLQGG